MLESADKTNLSRFFSGAPWFQERVNDRRLTYLLQQTQTVHGPKADSMLIFDDTLCEHVGSLFDYVDRHYNRGVGKYAGLIYFHGLTGGVAKCTTSLPLSF